MPEPLVPHRGSRYRQTTMVEVQAGGSLFFVDQLSSGRVGHGETWAWDRLQLDLTVRVGGELALRERLDQSGEELRHLAELAGSGASACFANALLIAPEAAESSAPWRAELAALHQGGLWLGISALRCGGWSIKLVATDSIQLRQGLREMRGILAPYFPRLRCDARKL